MAHEIQIKIIAVKSGGKKPLATQNFRKTDEKGRKRRKFYKIFCKCVIVAPFRATFWAFWGIGERGF